MSRGKLTKFVTQAGKTQASAAAKKVGPISTLDMGDFKILRGVSAADRKTHLNVLEKVKSFDQLKLPQLVRQNIARNILKSPDLPPTPVQKVAIKALTKKTQGFRPWLIAAETGSGKTLSYLAPLLANLATEAPNMSEAIEMPSGVGQQVHEETVTEAHTTEASKQRAPQGPFLKNIILVPTVELANQVASTLDKCVRGIEPPVTYEICAGLQTPTSVLAKRVVRGLDVAIGTPDKLLKVCKEQPVLMQRALESCSYLVVDEADSLMNVSFEESTTKLIRKCSDLQHLIFVSATIPRSFDKQLRKMYPTLSYLVTPSIHRLPRHIEFRVVETWHRPYNNNKQLALQQALYSIYHDKTEEGSIKRVVVFVNLKRDVDPLVNALKSAGYDAMGLNTDRSNLEDYVRAQPASEDSPKMRVLVATDLVARGVDFQRVRNIVLYDMPPNAADLLHRAGRTGRLGTKGRVILLVAKKENKGWIRGLETIVKKGMALA